MPLWLPKKLKAIRVFKVAKNRIESVSEAAQAFTRQVTCKVCMCKKYTQVSNYSLYRSTWLISCCLFYQLSELTKLRPLKDLCQVIASENPVATLPHYRGMLLFHLKTVDNLDGQHVTLQERHTATQRFQQGMTQHPLTLTLTSSFCHPNILHRKYSILNKKCFNSTFSLL